MYYIVMNKNGLQSIDFLHEREDSYEGHTKYRKNEYEPEYILASPRRPSFSFFFGCQKTTKFRGGVLCTTQSYIYRPMFFSYVRMISPAVELCYSSDTHLFRLKK